VADLVITAACLWVLFSRGIAAFQGIFWLKIVSYGMIYYFVNALRKNQYYYYNNLGLNKKTLWSTTLVLDFSLYIILIILTYQLRCTIL